MFIAFRRELAIPLWVVAFSAVALGAPTSAMPFLVTLLVISVIASTMPALERRFGLSRRTVEVLPAVDDVLAAAASRRHRRHP
jgi:hypothetical protein